MFSHIHRLTSQDARKRRSRAKSLSQDFNLSGVFHTKTPRTPGTPRRHQRSGSKGGATGERGSVDYGDRFIPSRSGANSSVQLHHVTNTSTTNENTPTSRANEAGNTPMPATPKTATRTQQDSFNDRLAESLFEGQLTTGRTLSFKSPTKPPRPNKADEHHDTLREVST